MSVPEQLQFTLGDQRIAAQRWGRGGEHKILALHGWLDNSASFHHLAPQLDQCECVAIDMAGHGRSSYRPGTGAYNIWQDLGEVLQIVDQLAWSSFFLLGHSRGAMVACLFAGTFPQKVCGVIAIDALLPLTIDESELPQQLQRSISALLNLGARETVYYRDLNQAVHVRAMGRFPLSIDASSLLAERGVSENESGFFWSHDPRLLVSSEIRLSKSQALAFLDNFGSRALLFVASKGMFQEQGLAWMLTHKNIEVVHVDGPHHLHLQQNLNTTKKLAKKTHEYISR